MIRRFINDVYIKHQVQLVIVQDYRTYAQQDALYAKGRTTSGSIVTNAKGGQSNHNFALAVMFFHCGMMASCIWMQSQIRKILRFLEKFRL